MSIIVAIDGPAGAGKSTIAKLVAERLGATLLDTGAIYRGLALAARREGIAWDDEEGLAALAAKLPLRFQLRDGENHVLLADDDISAVIRTPEISSGASQVSGLPQVRAALLEMQRRFADRGSVVAEGRDIGTVVFPGASVKVFMNADERARARRRLGDLRASGDEETTLEQVLEAQQRRDAADSGRAVAPLVPADDATQLDTSGLTVEQTVEAVLALVP
ncbi:MAG: cytidylate kinase [Deltaproteobacteria bacterium]|nr:MAG: cytidylate kinase [Pseudomonadota bacterium]PIE65512.1 MAG: cytidylate kinase [Deltaproteobacteria bacterium]